jgi:hypothetical protein
MWKNLIEPGRSQMTIWLMRIAYWITKAINTYSEHMMPVIFPLQQWLQERARILRYVYLACLVFRHQFCGIFNQTCE